MLTNDEKVKQSVSTLSRGEEISIRSVERQTGLSREDVIRGLMRTNKERRFDIDLIHGIVRRYGSA